LQQQQNIAIGEREKSDAEILDYKVEENGQNFSLGERQLICLARAMIVNNLN
jgi:ABC-type multidrug transport system fused ATPase/permease subunit